MIFDVRNCTINEKASIKEALEVVDANKYGFIFSHNDEGQISGLATDGDIRRALISGVTIDEPLSNCVNRNFLSATQETSRSFD